MIYVIVKLKQKTQIKIEFKDKYRLYSYDLRLNKNRVLFNYIRTKDLNYNFAISDKNETLNMYYQKELSQLSTIEYEQAKKVFQGPIKEKKIQALTLNEILKKSKIEKKIDLLDIDVEGADLKVLQSLSFDKHKPELICVEIHEKNIKESKTFKFLDSCNYELIWSGVFSHIFRSKS